MQLSDELLGFPNITFSPEPWMLWGLLVVFASLYLIMSCVLYYHWIAYGMRSKGVLLAEIVFPFGSAILFYIAGVSLGFL